MLNFLTTYLAYKLVLEGYSRGSYAKLAQSPALTEYDLITLKIRPQTLRIWYTIWANNEVTLDSVLHEKMYRRVAIIPEYVVLRSN